MSLSRCVPSPTRRQGADARPLAILLVAALALVGCATGYVTTSTGAVVPAATVQAQDITGDALSILQDVHNAAVTAHDAKSGAEPADVHAKRRAALLASASGIRAAWDGLSAWKAGSGGEGLATVALRVRPAVPELLRAAVELKLISQTYADAIGAFFGTASQGLTPKALERKAVTVSDVREPGPSGIELVQVPRWSDGTLRIVDNGCTADDIARGLCVGGCTSSIPPKCSYWPMGRAQTLEMPLLDRGAMTLLTNPPRTLEVPR